MSIEENKKLVSFLGLAPYIFSGTPSSGHPRRSSGQTLRCSSFGYSSRCGCFESFGSSSFYAVSRLCYGYGFFGLFSIECPSTRVMVPSS